MSAPLRTEPTRSLFDPSPITQHKYVPAASTDIQATFARIRAELAAKPANVKQIRRTK